MLTPTIQAFFDGDASAVEGIRRSCQCVDWDHQAHQVLAELRASFPEQHVLLDICTGLLPIYGGVVLPPELICACLPGAEDLLSVSMLQQARWMLYSGHLHKCSLDGFKPSSACQCLLELDVAVNMLTVNVHSKRHLQCLAFVLEHWPSVKLFSHLPPDVATSAHDLLAALTPLLGKSN